MCRHLAYVGSPRRIGELLSDPPFSLVRQAWAPRRQTHGIMNADGFGVGWYAPGDPEPIRHRGDGPVWADETFADLCRGITTTALLGAVRSATNAMVHGPLAAAPFRSGRWLFSHNGALAGWPASGGDLVKDLSGEAVLRMQAPTDSAVLWALTVDRLEAGLPPGEALAAVVERVRATTGGGRLNLLLTDGETVAATALGASLCIRQPDGGIVVASEPYDDEPGWADVPGSALVTATPETLRIDDL
jgi:gamma-glutamyl hercynylcysteine S-oxide hydrolase